MSFIYLALAVFSIGMYGVLTRRDLIGVLACVEIMLGAATLLLIGLATTSSAASGAAASGGNVGAIGLVILVLAAAEAAVGMALLLAVAKRTRATRVDDLMEVKG